MVRIDDIFHEVDHILEEIGIWLGLMIYSRRLIIYLRRMKYG